MRQRSPEDSALRSRRSLALGLLSSIAFAIGGCSGGERRELERGPLPYSVGVFFDAGASSLPDQGANTSLRAPRFEKSGREVAAAVAQALAEERPVVAVAEVLESSGADEALETGRGSFDYLLGVGVTAPAAYARYSRPPGTAALEIFAWLFGGLGSWFVPDLSYETDTEMRVSLLDPNAEGGRGWREDLRLVADRSSLSLWDRSAILERPGDYALTIIVPPMFVTPETHDRQSAALTAGVLSDLNDQLAESLKARLIDLELSSPLRVTFRSPRPGSSLAGGQPELILGIASKDGVRLSKLDVHRLAEGYEPFRWVAPADRLEEWNRRLAAPQGGHRTTAILPVTIPLVPGTNVVRVRALREDGERVTRTALYEFRY